jgi:hypothetical protein
MSDCACPRKHEHEPQRIPEGSTITIGKGGTIIIEPPETGTG